MEPINVQSDVVFNQLSPHSVQIYTVPDGKLLIIEEASAGAYDSATAIVPGIGFVSNVYVRLALTTNQGPLPTLFGFGDHVIVAGVGLPMVGGRTMRAYAAPGTNVLFTISNCLVKVNASMSFSGQLVDFP